MDRCTLPRAGVRACAPFGFTLVIAALSAVFLACGGGASAPSSASTHGGRDMAIEASLGNTFVRAGVPSQVVARIALTVRPVDRNERPPVNLALVVDTSGSMEGRAIEDARAAATALLDALSPKDRIAVVVFHSKAEVLLPSTRLDDADVGGLKKKLAAMRAEGTTDLANGLQAGLDEVQKNLDPQGVNRIVLVGDGVPNDEAPVMPLAEIARARGISITTLGLGADYNETLMGAIAQKTGGAFHYVDDSSKVLAFFKEEVVRLQKVYARSAVLELRPGPGVVVDGVVGMVPSRAGASVQVPLGDMSLGDKREIVVRVSAGIRKDGAPVELLDAVLRFTEGTGGAQIEKRAFLGVRATTDDAKLTSGRNEDVERTAKKMQDAADTLDRIRTLRDGARSQLAPATGGGGGANGPAMPLDRQAPSKAPRAPMPAPAAPAAAAVMDEAPEVVRKQHDDAMRTLQGH